MRRHRSEPSGGVDLLVERSVRRCFSAPAPDLGKVIARVTSAARAAQRAPDRRPARPGAAPAWMALLAASVVLGLAFFAAGEPIARQPAEGEGPRLARVWSDSLSQAVAFGVGLAALRAWQGRKGRRPSWEGDGARLWLPGGAECLAEVAYDAAAGGRVLVFRSGGETTGVILLPGAGRRSPEGFVQRRLGGWTAAVRADDPVGRELLAGFAERP